MMLTITALSAFQDNYIWVLHNQRHAIVVDPGDDAPVRAFLDAHRLTLVAVLITHHHRDHTGGALALRQDYRCAVYGPNNPMIKAVTHSVREDDTLDFAELGLKLKVIDLPGHTLDHIAYYGAKHLFCGDTVFGCGCGKLFEGTPEMMSDSLDKILALPDTMGLYCGHEYTLSNISFALTIDDRNAALHAREHADRMLRQQLQPTLPSHLALEKATNPFLRFRHPDMIAFAEGYLGRTALTPADVFGAIRAAKDAWDSLGGTRPDSRETPPGRLG